MGFSANDKGVRQVLIGLVGVFTLAAWREKRRAKKAEKEAKKMAKREEDDQPWNAS